MSNLKLRTNVLCTRLSEEDGRDIAAVPPEELRHRLTYFELTALRDASPFNFPGHWAEQGELTEAQCIHRDAFLRDYRESPWNPELDGFVPFDPIYPLAIAVRQESAESRHVPARDDRELVTVRLARVERPSAQERTRHEEPGRAWVKTPHEVTDQQAVPGEIVDQERVINADVSESLLVLAPPGTGKTHVLVERLTQLLKNSAFRNPAAEILVLSFTRATVAEVRRRLQEKVGAAASDNLRYIAVTTFDAYATRVLAESGYEHLLHADSIRHGESSWDARVRALADVLDEVPGHNRIPDAVASLRYLIVDEIQDLVGPRARLVHALVRHVHHADGGVLLLGDPAQAIYDWNNPKPDSREFLAGLRASIHGRGREVALGQFFRFADKPMEDLVKRLWEAVGRDGSAPDGEELRNILYSLGPPRRFADLPALISPNQSLAVLVRNNAQAHQVALWLEGNSIPFTHHVGEQGRHWPAGLAQVFLGWKMDFMGRDRLEHRLENLSNASSEEEARKVIEVLEHCRVIDDTKIDVGRLRHIVCTQPAPSHRDRPTGIVVSTVHRSKGLEYDTVLVLEPEHAEDPEELRILYVAATRASRKLHLLHSDPQILRRSKKVGRSGYWRTGEHIYLNRSKDLESDVLADHLVRKFTPKDLQERLWSTVRATGTGQAYLYLCMRERNGKEYFTVALKDEAGFEDVCCCGDGFSRALWGQSGKANDLGGGLRGWRVPVNGLESVAFSPSDEKATEMLGKAGMAWLPILRSPVSTKGGD